MKHTLNDRPAQPYLQAQLSRAAQYGQQGHFQEAEKICVELLKRFPNHPEALHLAGLAALQQQKIPAAIDFFQKAIRAQGKNPAFYNHLGVAYCYNQQVAEGLQAYGKAIQLNSSFAEAHLNLGIALAKAKRWEEAKQHDEKACALAPNNPIAWNELGNLYQVQGDLSQAVMAYQQALKINPHYAEGYYNLGMALRQQHQLEAAKTCYQKALALKPHYIEARNNLGTIFMDLEQASAGIEQFKQVLAENPHFIPAIKNLGDIYLRLDRYQEAIAVFKQGLSQQPDHLELLNAIVLALKNDAEWNELEVWQSALMTALQKALAAGELCHLSPFSALSLPFDQALCAKIAADHAHHTFQSIVPKVYSVYMTSKLRKLRIGYVTADFRDHPVGHLLPGVLEHNDRAQFEIIAYSIGPEDHSTYRSRIKKACDQFIDLAQRSIADGVDRIRSDQVDILIDLMGYTNYAKPEIFAHRCAPIQIGYLGYPGTCGGSFLDYYIADPTALPETLGCHFSEKILYLPHAYFATDDHMAVAAEPPTRAECQLPEDVFVYCCFCTHYKLSLPAFNAWMKILAAVPNSVLWLFSRTESFEQNLRKIAMQQNISADRIIFAKRESKERHLARHRHADLFLDTFLYNAHTTAIDALWTGVPLITYLGQTMQSRVSAALLKAIDLPELITVSVEEYIEKAISYGRNKDAHAALKQKLQDHILTTPLFNTAGYTRDLEKAYRLSWDRWIDQQTPTTMFVESEMKRSKTLE